MPQLFSWCLYAFQFSIPCRWRFGAETCRNYLVWYITLIVSCVTVGCLLQLSSNLHLDSSMTPAAHSIRLLTRISALLSTYRARYETTPSGIDITELRTNARQYCYARYMQVRSIGHLTLERKSCRLHSPRGKFQCENTLFLQRAVIKFLVKEESPQRICTNDLNVHRR